MNNDQNVVQLRKVIKYLIEWEEEERQMFFQQNDNDKKFYYISKSWMKKLKSIIKYDELITKINKNSKSIEQIIEEFTDNELENLDFTSVNRYGNNSKDADILNQLIRNKKFILEIVNENLFNSLFICDKTGFEISRKIINKKVIFELKILIKKIIILLFKVNNTKICEIFFILDDGNENSCHDLYKFVENNDINQIIEELQIDVNNNNKGEYKTIKLGNSEIKFLILFKKIKYNHIFPFLEKEIIHQIKKFFEVLYKSNIKFKESLKYNNTIGDNYNPCKLINKEWMNNFIHFFNYKEKESTFSFGQNVNKNDYEKLVQNIPEITDDNIEKGEFYICDQQCIMLLKPLMPETFKVDNYKDYKIYLNDSKGAIIINHNIYIFEAKEDINQRFYFAKIKGQKKFEFLYKMTQKEFEFELDKENWEILKSSVDENELGKEKGSMKISKLNEDKKKTPFGNDSLLFDLLDNSDKQNEEIKLKMEELSKEKQELRIEYNKKEKELKNKYDEKEQELNNKFIQKEQELNCKFDLKEQELNNKLNKKVKELEVEKNNLIEKEKELNKNKKVTLNIESPTIGLDNLGATCYMNAVLQCIAHFREVSEKILTWYKYMEDSDKTDRKLSLAFGELLDNLYFPHDNYNYKKSYSPKKFKELIGKMNPLFAGIQANDSKDIMNFIIEKMHSELNSLGETNSTNITNDTNNIIYDQTNELLTYNNFLREFKNNYHSFLSEYLYALQKTVTLCCDCKTMLYNFQTYNFLIFPLLDVKYFVINTNYQNPFFNGQNYVLNLIDCFKYYQKIDYFQGENQIYCNICKTMKNANYCNLLYSTPTILCIVLNRGKDNKDFKENIIFGTELNLSEFVQDKSDCSIYYLIGVVIHVGDSSMSGHFFSYSRNHFKSPWYKYNDSIVSICNNENEIFSYGTPYILFYHKYQ